MIMQKSVLPKGGQHFPFDSDLISKHFSLILNLKLKTIEKGNRHMSQSVPMGQSQLYHNKKYLEDSIEGLNQPLNYIFPISTSFMGNMNNRDLIPKMYNLTWKFEQKISSSCSKCQPQNP